MVTRRTASRFSSSDSWRSTMWVSSSLDRASKTTISSSRFRNSGLKLARTTDSTESRLACGSRVGSTRKFEPRLEVRISSVFRKSTVRPWPSVSRPSSSTWSRMSNTSGCAFSTSSSSTTEYGRRRADQTRDRVLLGVLAHVDAHDRPLVVEEEVRQRLGELGLAYTGGTEE